MQGTLTPEQVLAVFNKPDVSMVISQEYPNIEPFVLHEIKDFLDGKPGEDVKMSFMSINRSYQVRQCLSAIGARLVDREEADEETSNVYKAVWAIQVEGGCRICGRPIKFKLMFPQELCRKPLCHVIAMRENMR